VKYLPYAQYFKHGLHPRCYERLKAAIRAASCIVVLDRSTGIQREIYRAKHATKVLRVRLDIGSDDVALVILTVEKVKGLTYVAP
jgi:hypothetical protein